MICKRYIIWQRGFRVHSTHPTVILARRGRATGAGRAGPGEPAGILREGR